MHKAEFLEWTLARFMERERAAAILGDLLETAETRGRVWFWVAFARVLARLGWRLPAAWVVAYGMAALLYSRSTFGDLASNSMGNNVPEPTGVVSSVALAVLAMVSLSMWFVVPYGAVRFGPRDAMSRLAIPVCAVASLGFWFCHPQAVGFSSAVVQQALMISCAAMVLMIAVAALVLRQWRPVIALSAVGCAAVGVTIGIVNILLLLALRYEWSYEVRWVLVRVGSAIAFWIVAGAYSMMHGLLGSRLRRFLGAACVVAASGIALGNVPESPPTFVAAGVEVSAYSASREFRQIIQGDRLILRDATMLNLISAAYKMEAKSVIGGPNWLEWDRYDVVAKIAPNVDAEYREVMLQTLLAQRFKLVTHQEDQPSPAFALTIGKGKLKLKSGDPSLPSKCESMPQTTAADAVPYIVVRCISQPPEVMAQNIRAFAGGYVTAPVVDQTGLKGVWDFEIRWTAKNQLAKAGPDGISFFSALENQLGLHLEATTAPLPVLVVDSVNEKPTPNAPDLAKVMPPLPPGEFEVAVIKPSKPDTRMNGVMSGDQVNFQGVTLDLLVRAVWDLPDDGPTVVGEPKWMQEDHFDFLAKAARGEGDPKLDEDDLRVMVQKLLEDRFKLAAHTEDQSLDAYNLVAANPKLKSADPKTRTKCWHGPGADGKDPRLAHPILNKVLSCQDISMAQFASQIQGAVPGYIKTPVFDKTGLNGTYDFTLSYTGARKLLNGIPNADNPSSSDPSGGISFFEALEKQLGIKLEKTKRPIPVLVIDHVEKPSEN